MPAGLCAFCADGFVRFAEIMQFLATEQDSFARWTGCMARNQQPTPRPPVRLSEIYDEALPQVYRYLRARCGSTALAEELTSATLVQAAISSSSGAVPEMSVGWLITVARNKLIDHWRHMAVVDRSLVVLQGGLEDQIDPWDVVLDQARAAAVLDGLPPDYRSALTLRYLDDLHVPECAEVLGRSIHATESLLVRARNAFRSAYEATGGHHD